MSHLGDLLSAYLDGELNPAERDRVAAHLQGCELCRLDLEDAADGRAAVRSLPTLELPVLLLPGDVARIAERERLGWRVTAAVAVAAVAGVIGLVGVAAADRQAISPPDLAQVHLARTSGTGLGASGMAALVVNGTGP